MSIWDPIFLVFFGFSLYLFIKNPIRQRFGGPVGSDPTVGLVLSGLTFIYFYLAHFSLSLDNVGDTQPCGKKSIQIECYSISTEVCQNVWKHLKKPCQEEALRIRSNRPSFLAGSFVETCTAKSFDKMLFYSRKNSESTSCRSHFDKIEKQ